MLRTTVRRLHGEKPLTRAMRLQLGNVKTEYGHLQTAAGSHEKWGFIYRGWKYPMISHVAGGVGLLIIQMVCGFWSQYIDMITLSENICYEDIKDRCLTPMPGWTRLKCYAIITPGGCMTYRDPTPLDWLPFELKLGQVKQASY